MLYGDFFVIKYILNIDILNIFLNLLIGAEVTIEHLLNMTICILCSFVLGILLQSLSYFSININTKKIFSKCRFGLKRIFNFKNIKNLKNIFKRKQKENTESNLESTLKIELIQENEYIENVSINTDNVDINNNSNNIDTNKNYVIIDEPIEKLDYSSAFAASLFTTCLILFIICICFLIGYIASEELLYIL